MPHPPHVGRSRCLIPRTWAGLDALSPARGPPQAGHMTTPQPHKHNAQLRPPSPPPPPARPPRPPLPASDRRAHHPLG